MKGYKAFNSDLTCRDYQFTEGVTHVFEGQPVLCHSGFHFCTELQDVLKYYSHSTVRVFEIEASGIVTKGHGYDSKRACSELRLVKELTCDEVRDSINKCQPAYLWAMWHGNREEMKKFITESEYAYRWARDIGDREYMRQFVTESEFAHYWGRFIGDREYMKQFVTESEYVFYWAKNNGDREYMKEKITDPSWASAWVGEFGDRGYMLEKFPELKGRV